MKHILESVVLWFQSILTKLMPKASVCLHCALMQCCYVVPMANCAAVQPSLSATRCSSLILTSCLRPSSLFTRSFSHWYPFRRRKWRKKYCYRTDFTLLCPTDRLENNTEADFNWEISPPGRADWIKLTFIAALEHSGTPSLYFPVINPQASGDQVIAPTPERV